MRGEGEDEVDESGVGFTVTHDEISTCNTEALLSVLLVGEIANVASVARRGLEEVSDTLLDGRIADSAIRATSVVVEALRASEIDGSVIFDETTRDVAFVVDQRVGEDAV